MASHSEELYPHEKLTQFAGAAAEGAELIGVSVDEELQRIVEAGRAADRDG